MEPAQATPCRLVYKLCKVMAEIDGVAKAGHNDFHNYDYVKEADLVSAIRQKLAAQNVFIFTTVNEITTTEKTNERGKSSHFTTARITLTFVDGDTREERSIQFIGHGEDTSDKGPYKAYTGAMKHALMKNFLISAEDDDNRNQQKPLREPAQNNTNTLPQSVYPSQAQAAQAASRHTQSQPETAADKARRALWTELTKLGISDATAREWVRYFWAQHPKSGGELVESTKELPAWFFTRLRKGIANGEITADGINSFVQQHASQTTSKSSGQYQGYNGPTIERQEAS